MQTAIARLRGYGVLETSIRVFEGPFFEYESRFPFALVREGVSSMVPGMPCMPAAIADHVWLGAAMHAESPGVLSALRIRHVVSLMDDPGGAVVGGAVSTVQRWPWVDSVRFSIIQDLHAVADAIEAARADGGVLVHCFQGKSRSAAAVIAWLLKHGGLTGGSGERRTDRVHTELQGHRSMVQVNAGFLEQLRAWDQER